MPDTLPSFLNPFQASVTTFPIYNLLIHPLPDDNDWSKMTVKTFKEPGDPSRFPVLTAIAVLHDSDGHPLGYLGPVSETAKTLEEYSVNRNRVYQDHGYTSSQMETTRVVRAWNEMIQRHETAYRWNHPDSRQTSAGQVRDALTRSFVQCLKPKSFDRPIERYGIYDDAVERVREHPEEELGIYRKATSDYTNLYLIRKMSLSLDPVGNLTSLRTMPNFESQLNSLRRAERSAHGQTTLRECLRGFPCRYSSHDSEAECNAFRDSVESLRVKDFRDEFGILPRPA